MGTAGWCQQVTWASWLVLTSVADLVWPVGVSSHCWPWLVSTGNADLDWSVGVSRQCWPWLVSTGNAEWDGQLISSVVAAQGFLNCYQGLANVPAVVFLNVGWNRMEVQFLIHIISYSLPSWKYQVGWICYTVPGRMVYVYQQFILNIKCLLFWVFHGTLALLSLITMRNFINLSGYIVLFLHFCIVGRFAILYC